MLILVFERAKKDNCSLMQQKITAEPEEWNHRLPILSSEKGGSNDHDAVRGTANLTTDLKHN
jgi:hypothetical protein